jgi:hypothetical protein
MTYERRLDPAIQARAWRAVLADDERVTFESWPVELAWAIRETGY